VEIDHPIAGKFNNYGWRDEEWSLQKPQNTFRIALLGDSYIEALQVEDNKTFEYYTEILLNNSLDLNVELLNFGQSGFTQTEELLLLTREVIHFSPDMVILFFYPENDIDDISKATAFSTLRPFYRITDKDELILDTSFNKSLPFRMRALLTPFKKHSALISLIAERYNIYNQKKKIRISRESAANKNIQGTLSLATASPDPLYFENYKLNKLLIKKMAEFCKNKGILFMLVTVNSKTYIPAIETDFILIDPTFNSNFFDDDLEAFDIDE